MKYVGPGDSVLYEREKTKVVKLSSGGDSDFSAFLKKDNGEITKVRVLDIVWNGSMFFVSPDGVRKSKAHKEAQTVLKGVWRDLAVWDRKNPKSTRMERLNALNSLITEHIAVLVNEVHSDEILGQIVRAIFKEIYFEEEA